MGSITTKKKQTRTVTRYLAQFSAKLTPESK